MMVDEEFEGRRMEILLYRCVCQHCDAAEKELMRLARQYGALLDVKRVDREPGLEDYAGWRTPIVYIDGRQISHYQVNAKRWEAALRQDAIAAPSMVIGEIVDIHCYIGDKAKGEQHKECAARCIRAGQPIGLLTRNGRLYLLIQDKALLAPYERLKELASEEVRVSGDICERGGVQTMTVKGVESAAQGGGLF